MTKQPDISLEIVRWKKEGVLRPRLLSWRPDCTFFDFRLYDRNYEGSEGGQCSAVQWSSGGRLIAAIDSRL